MSEGSAFTAVVLAGGTAVRLDGADKASVELHGRTLLTWALDAVLDAAEVVVVVKRRVAALGTPRWCNTRGKGPNRRQHALALDSHHRCPDPRPYLSEKAHI